MATKGLGKGLGALIPSAPPEKKEQAKAPSPKKASQPKEASESKTRVQDTSVRHEATGARIYEIPLESIIPNPDQPRKHFDRYALEELTSSVKEHGILQPLVVLPENKEGKHVLVAGERRLRAAEMAESETVPAVIRDADTHDRMALAIIENVQRADLNPVEEAQAYQKLMDEYNLTQEDVAKRLGKNRSTIANTLRLLELPDEIRRALVDGKLSLGHAKVLASLDSAEEQKQYAKQALEQKMTVRDLEQATTKKRKQRVSSGESFDPVQEAQEQMLRERLGTKVQIKKNGEKGQILLHFYSLEELQRLLNELS